MDGFGNLMQIELSVQLGKAAGGRKREGAPCFALKLAKNTRSNLFPFFLPKGRTIVAEIKLDTRQEEMKSLSLLPPTGRLNSHYDDKKVAT